MEDRNIVDLFFRREEQAISETSNKYGKLLFRIAENILHNKEEASECVNDTYLSLWNSIPPNDPESLMCYAARLTRNSALSLYRKKNAFKRGDGRIEEAYGELSGCLPDSKGLEEKLDEKELGIIINEFLDILPKKSRIIFVRKYWRFDSIKDIAKDLRISEGNVKTVLFRTRKQLKELLTEKGLSI